MNDEERKKERFIVFTIWSLINIFWWIVSVFFGFFGVDLNPIFDNTGEIVANIIIYLIGVLLWYIMYLKKEEDENVNLEAK